MSLVQVYETYEIFEVVAVKVIDQLRRANRLAGRGDSLQVGEHGHWARLEVVYAQQHVCVAAERAKVWLIDLPPLGPVLDKPRQRY